MKTVGQHGGRADQAMAKVIAMTAMTIGSLACASLLPPLAGAEPVVPVASAIERAHMRERPYRLSEAGHDLRQRRGQACQRLEIADREFDGIDVDRGAAGSRRSSSWRCTIGVPDARMTYRS